MSNNTLYQYGTLALLVPGLFKGTLKITDLLKHGDTGIGTGDGLDGELIIKDGQAYQVKGDGRIWIVPDDFTVPFADVHYADYRPIMTVSADHPLTNETLPSTLLSQKPWENSFFAIQAHGTFATVTTRSINRQSEPYPSLVECAHNQHEFHGKNVTGTIIGYYSPAIFNGPAVGGFHLHFIADDLSIGGHLLSYEITHGTVSVQLLDELIQKLPSQSAEFMQHDFSQDDIAGAIGEAE
jgi:acetolactate decarboxylase